MSGFWEPPIYYTTAVLKNVLVNIFIYLLFLIVFFPINFNSCNFPRLLQVELPSRMNILPASSSKFNRIPSFATPPPLAYAFKMPFFFILSPIENRLDKGLRWQSTTSKESQLKGKTSI